MSKQIPLTQGKFAIVDDEDFEWLNQWKWRAQRTYKDIFYAERDKYLGGGHNGNYQRIKMHRLIMGLSPKDKKFIDHRNGNSLDNQRKNLRIATTSQNAQNSRIRMQPSKTSRFKGVYWNKKNQRWIARVYLGKGKVITKSFTNEITAARAYDRMSIEFFGEFAYPNFERKKYEMGNDNSACCSLVL